MTPHDLRTKLAAGFALLAVAFAPACGRSPGDADSAPWLARYSGGVSGDDAALIGTLVRDGNCLYVGRVFPIFPADSQFDEAHGVLTVLGKRFRVGETFRSGGGEAGTYFSSYLTPPDPSCDLSRVWIVGDVD